MIDRQVVDGCFCDTGPHDCVEVHQGVDPVCADLNCGLGGTGDRRCDENCNCVDLVDPNLPDPNTPAEVFDHFECYQIKTKEKLKGIVDLEGPQFGVDAGCKIGKAKEFCVPVMKTVRELDTKDTLTPQVFVGPNQVTDLICYNIKCRNKDVGEHVVEDQFGTRLFRKFKSKRLCTPARKVPTPP